MVNYESQSNEKELYYSWNGANEKNELNGNDIEGLPRKESYVSSAYC